MLFLFVLCSCSENDSRWRGLSIDPHSEPTQPRFYQKSIPRKKDYILDPSYTITDTDKKSAVIVRNILRQIDIAWKRLDPVKICEIIYKHQEEFLEVDTSFEEHLMKPRLEILDTICQLPLKEKLEVILDEMAVIIVDLNRTYRLNIL
jgi:hypothetical protein